MFIVTSFNSLLVEEISFILKGSTLVLNIFCFCILTLILNIPVEYPNLFNVTKGAKFKSCTNPWVVFSTLKSLKFDTDGTAAEYDYAYHWSVLGYSYITLSAITIGGYWFGL